MNGAHLNALSARILWTGHGMNEMKLCEGKFRLDMKKRFFSERVVGHWSRLPKEAVMAPGLSVFKEHLVVQFSFRKYCRVGGWTL